MRGMAPERIAQSEAVALLLERAREAGAAFEVTPSNQAAVIELARRFDGMPLAIELACVRLRTLGLDQVVERLNDRFHLLVGGAGPLRPASRHSKRRSPGATISSIPTIELFCAVCPCSPAPSVWRRPKPVGQAGNIQAAQSLDGLTDLVERSFVVREGTNGTGTVSAPRNHA